MNELILSMLAALSITAAAVFFGAWLGAKHTAEDYREKWQRTADYHEREKRESDKWRKAAYENSDRANAENKRADDLLNKLRNYGLEEMP